MKKFLFVVASLLLISSGVFLSQSAQAAWNPNNIIADPVFDNYGTMSDVGIQNFLNGFPNSCIKNYQSPYPNGYDSYGGDVSAATVIKRAADIYGFNPQVILATLQKESSLVTGDGGCEAWRYNSAMGMACPDGGQCPAPGYEGFSKQVTKGSWLLKFGKERANGNVNWTANDGVGGDPYVYYSGPVTQGCYKRQVDAQTICYDGYWTIDGQTIHIDTGATGSFYNYTPHFHGNQNFVSIFEGWFGSTQVSTPFAWQWEGQQAFSDSGRNNTLTSFDLAPGGTAYVRVRARNMGYETWTNSGANPVRLGTFRPADRPSSFAVPNGWPWYNRAANLLESSVTPGQIGTFEFPMTAPSSTGTYREYFNLLSEGRAWMNDLGLYFEINVVNPTAPLSDAVKAKLTSGQQLNGGQYLISQDTHSVLAMQGDGNLVLYRNFKPVWTANTSGNYGSRLVMQADGNLVVYSNTNVPLWNSQTNGYGGADLSLQTDGNVVVYQGGSARWATMTVHNPDLLGHVNPSSNSIAILQPGQRLETANRQFRLILQEDGNLVLYSPNRATWASWTQGQNVAYLAIQSDGNLVIYGTNGQALWNSHTNGRGASMLVMQADGNLVLYANNGFGPPIWHTNTNGIQ